MTFQFHEKKNVRNLKTKDDSTLFIFQKQYMFVYRAIMEMAQFGDTEVNSSELKTTWQQLLENAGKTLELEFARCEKSGST